MGIVLGSVRGTSPYAAESEPQRQWMPESLLPVKSVSSQLLVIWAVTSSLYNAMHSVRDELSWGRWQVTRDEAWDLANHWVAAWNAHDLDLIMAHYEDAIELTSPVAAQLLGITGGKVVGKANLRAYFQRGLEAYPNLHFHLEDVLWGQNSVVFYYTNQKGTHSAEFMELSETGKVKRVVAHYSA